MAHKTTYKVKHKRNRQGITNKEKRLAIVKSGKPKLTVRTTGKNVVCQIIKYNPLGDETLANATAKELKNYGYTGHNGNATAAYLTGYLCGKKAAAKKINEAVLDIGRKTPVLGSNAFAALKGAVDAGITIPHSEEAFPDESRIKSESVKAEINKGVKESRKTAPKTKE